MKKLLEDLQKHLDNLTIPNDGFGKGWKTGYVQALQIVRAHTPWNDVGELPPKEYDTGCELHGSIHVIVTDGKRRATAFYVYNTKEWSCSRRNFIPTHWAYLPDLPK